MKRSPKVNNGVTLPMRHGDEYVYVNRIFCVLGGLIALIRGEWLAGAVLIFIMAPVGYGQHVALGMALVYARGSD